MSQNLRKRISVLKTLEHAFVFEAYRNFIAGIFYGEDALLLPT